MESNQKKKKRRRGTGKMLWRFMAGTRTFFVLSFLFAALMALMELIQPQIISYTIDTLLGGKPSTLPDFANRLVDAFGGAAFFRDHLWVVACIIIGVALVSVSAMYLFMVFNTRAGEGLVKRTRDMLFGHIERLPFSWHSRVQTGDTIQRCTSDVDTVKRFLNDQLVSIFRIVLLITLSLIFMFSMSVPLTWVAVAFMPVILLYSMFFHRQIRKRFLECDENEGVLSQMAQENLTGVRVVRAFGREVYERDRFERQNRTYTGLWSRVMRLMTAYWASADLIAGIQALLIIVLGASMCIGETPSMTPGVFVAFISYNAMMTWPIRQLGRMLSEMSKASVSVDRIAEIMNAEEETDAPGALEPPMNGDIVFDSVTFGYEEGVDVLKNVSFTLPGGTTLGILGGTGSGKSTLVSLIDRLYDPKAGCGTITIGGVDLRKIRAEWVRRHVGIVLQEPFLFSRSIAENIAIATPGATRDDIRAAARVACLDESIEHFTDGYDTTVGERGVTLSGGQKQRCAIARLLIQHTPILIFDDSLSAVDTETDAKIRHALTDEMKGATVILIAHRITTLMHADHIIVLDGGTIREEGSHEELLRKNGVYRRIYDIQTGGGLEEAKV